MITVVYAPVGKHTDTGIVRFRLKKCRKLKFAKNPEHYRLMLYNSIQTTQHAKLFFGFEENS